MNNNREHSPEAGPPSPAAAKRHRAVLTRGGRIRRLAAMASVPALAVAGMAGLALASAAPANAATQNVGSYSEAYGGFLGNAVTPDGTYIYCVQPQGGDLTGSTTDLGVTGSVSGEKGVVPAAGVQWMNYVLTKYGATQDPTQAAAVALAVYAWVGNANSADPMGSLQAGMDYLASGHPDIANEYTAIYNDASANYQSGSSTGSGVLEFNVDTSNNYNGTVVMNGTPGSTGTITLTNGVFTNSGTNTETGIAEGQSLGVVGVPPDASGNPYQIAGTGTFQAPGGGAVAQNVHMWANGGGQNGVSAGTTQANSPFTVVGHDPSYRSPIFQPAASTTAGPAAQRSVSYAAAAGGSSDNVYLKAGAPLVDNVTATTVPNAKGVNNPWFEYQGKYATVKYQGMAYYSPTKLAEGELTPAMAASLKQVGHAYATFGGTGANPAGTTQAITFTGADASQSGWYYFIWEANWAQQDPTITQHVIPEDYGWQSNIENTESMIHPPSVTTRASSNPVGLPIHDTATVGSPASADMGLSVVSSAYQGVGTRDKATGAWTAGDSSNVCTGTPLFTTPAVAVTKPGDYQLADYTPTKAGIIVWQEKLVDSHGQVVSTGKCGESSETSTVPQVAVTTQAAQTSADKGDQVNDTAIVLGTVKAGDHIRFQLFCPTSGAASANDTLLATTGDTQVGPVGVANGLKITGASVSMPVACSGAYWVETYLNANGDVLAKDTPGAASETFNSTSPAQTLSSTPVVGG